MALSYKARKRLSFLILLVGLPIYVVFAITVVGWLDRTSLAESVPGFIWIEFLVYVILGIAWVLPFKSVFKGTAKPDPDQPSD